MDQIGQLLKGVNIPPITVKIDEESSNNLLKNVFLVILLAGTGLIVINALFQSQIRK